MRGGVNRPRNHDLHDTVMQAAFEILSRELYGPLCPFERANDLTLSICCYAHGVLKVRGHGLFWGGPHPDLADALRKQVRLASHDLFSAKCACDCDERQCCLVWLMRLLKGMCCAEMCVSFQRLRDIDGVLSMMEGIAG